MFSRVALPILLISLKIIMSTKAASFNCSQPPDFGNFDINSCCRLPEINLGNAPQKCEEYVKSLKSYNSYFPAYIHVCYPECIYRETGSLVDDVIQMDKVREFLTTNISAKDKEIIPQIIGSFENCVSNISDHMIAVGIKQFAKLQEGCSPYGSLIYGCVNTQTFIHCPASMWKTSDQKCNIGKNFVEQCNPLPHVPLPV